MLEQIENRLDMPKGILKDFAFSLPACGSLLMAGIALVHSWSGNEWYLWESLECKKANSEAIVKTISEHPTVCGRIYEGHTPQQIIAEFYPQAQEDHARVPADLAASAALAAVTVGATGADRFLNRKSKLQTVSS